MMPEYYERYNDSQEINLLVFWGAWWHTGQENAVQTTMEKESILNTGTEVIFGPYSMVLFCWVALHEWDRKVERGTFCLNELNRPLQLDYQA
jgi:hypothetical protein